MAWNDTTLDVLTLGGEIIPLGGEGEALRVTLPPSSTVTPTRSGGIKSKQTNRVSTITVSCYPNEATYRALWRRASTRSIQGGLAVPEPGSVFIAGTGVTVSWPDSAITQLSDTVSSVDPEIVTFIITLTDYSITVPPVAP